MGDLIITPKAAADVDEAWEYISQRNLKAANRLVDRFFASAKLHSQFPMMGESREEISPGLRCFSTPPYIAFYRIEGPDIRILRVLHGKSDVRRVMQGEPDDE